MIEMPIMDLSETRKKTDDRLKRIFQNKIGNSIETEDGAQNLTQRSRATFKQLNTT